MRLPYAWPLLVLAFTLILRRSQARMIEDGAAKFGEGVTGAAEYVRGRDRDAERRERFMIGLTAASVGVSMAAVVVAAFA